MSERPLPLFFCVALRDLHAWFNDESVPYVLIGGIACSLLGRPRTTKDIDVLTVLDEARWEDFVKSGRAHGFETRLSDAVAFAHESQVLLMHHRESALDVDIIIAGLPFENDMVQHGTSRAILDTALFFPSYEDLIVMKAVAARPRDIEDIRGLLSVHPDVDWAKIIGWVKDFSEALDASDILRTIETLRRERDISFS